MTSNFCILIPYDEKDIFFLVLFLDGLLGLIELFNFSFLGISGWGIDLDYCDESIIEVCIKCPKNTGEEELVYHGETVEISPG